MTSDVTLVLRGNPIARYVDELKNLAARLGVSHRLRLEPPAPPESMVELAGEHDVLFGSQPGIDNFHQLALGNKVFTGMTAGLALALTDTVAHRRLACSLDGAAFLVPDQDAEALAKLLDGLFGDPARLMAAKDAAWDAATTRYNWDREGVILADLAREAVANRSTLAHRDTA